MAKGSYLGGSTIYDGRMSPPIVYAVPDYQSVTAARLLGSENKSIVTFGEALIRLEGTIHRQIEAVRLSELNQHSLENQVRTLTIPSPSPRYSEFHQQMIARAITSDAKTRERKFAELISLNQELAAALLWADCPDNFKVEIKQFVRRWKK